jgi:hypothetical protein
VRRVVLVAGAARHQEFLRGRPIELQLEVGIGKRLGRRHRMLAAFFGLLPLFLEEERRPPAASPSRARSCGRRRRLLRESRDRRRENRQRENGKTSA